jgi:hypothetical protein
MLSVTEYIDHVIHCFLLLSTCLTYESEVRLVQVTFNIYTIHAS